MRRWKSWSLQRRVLVVSGLAITLAVVLGVVAFAISLDRILYSSALDAARVQAAQVADLVDSGEEAPDVALEDVPSQGSLLQILDASGQVVASNEPTLRRASITSLRPGPGEIEVTQSTSIPGEIGEPHAIVARGVQDPSGATYAVVVGAPLNVENDTVQSATTLLALGAVGLLAILLFLISRILRQALEPVERIRAEVDRITQVRGRGQLTVPATGDEIARLAETMNLMLGRLEQADTATRRFVSDASHELRSPIATIRAAMEIAESTAVGNSGEFDAVIHGEVLRMQRLVDDLLTLAKADDGAMPMVAEDVDLDDLVDAEVRRLRATTGVDVVVSIEAGRVVGDPARLGQVLRNLIDNAVRHTTGGVAVAVATMDGEVVLTVDNDGPPIPLDKRDLVFARFARLEGARERDRGGSGLGLAIVQTVVSAHGGTVRATQSDTGQCRFIVSLPASE